eukprot:Amastigsp_a508441_271.p3 type:complete len:180 gc:universal Amastigsp_a508441_271:134-673(+)
MSRSRWRRPRPPAGFRATASTRWASTTRSISTPSAARHGTRARLSPCSRCTTRTTEPSTPCCSMWPISSAQSRSETGRAPLSTRSCARTGAPTQDARGPASTSGRPCIGCSSTRRRSRARAQSASSEAGARDARSLLGRSRWKSRLCRVNKVSDNRNDISERRELNAHPLETVRQARVA